MKEWKVRTIATLNVYCFKYKDNEYIVTNIDSSCETIDIQQKDKTERLTININDPYLVKYIDVDGGHKKKKLLNKSKRNIKKNKKSCNKK